MTDSFNQELEKDEFYLANLKMLKSTLDVVKFVQIGAFDGVTYDELHEIIVHDEKFNGLLVEPLRKPFQVLKETYKHRNWCFENIAITEKDEMRQIWTIPYDKLNDETLPKWATGCSTLLQDSNALFGKHCQSKEEYEVLKNNTIIEFVNCTHLDKILKKHDFKNCDLFHIDTEGYDWLIIKQLDLEHFKPKVIHFEFFNLTTAHYTEILHHLNVYGYRLFQFANNITATILDIKELQNYIPEGVLVTPV